MTGDSSSSRLLQQLQTRLGASRQLFHDRYFGRGLEIHERWLRPGVTREQIAERLRPLLALERALSSS
jgi:hypothetical protein